MRGRRARGLSQAVLAGIVIGAIAVAWFWSQGTDPREILDQLGVKLPATTAPSAPAVTGSGGNWWHVYFTDPLNVNDPNASKSPILESLIARINNAKSAIHIAAFEFDLTSVAEALIAARQRGVDVRWVTDDEYGIGADSDEGHGQFAMLRGAGIEVKDDGRAGLMHNKFWVFDNQSVWTGATNITVNGIFHNNNNVIVIDSPQLAAIFEREFAEMWAGQFGSTSPSTVNDQAVTIDGTPIQALFASEDGVAGRLVPLIENAQTSVRFMAFSFTQAEMGSAMLARARAGVNVMGIFETRGSETEFSQMPALYCAGVPVRQDGNPSTFHHKVIVIDDRIVVTGSFNFSNNADENNDENVVIVTNRDIAAQFLQEFERRWAEATEPNAADMHCN